MVKGPSSKLENVSFTYCGVLEKLFGSIQLNHPIPKLPPSNPLQTLSAAAQQQRQQKTNWWRRRRRRRRRRWWWWFGQNHRMYVIRLSKCIWVIFTKVSFQLLCPPKEFEMRPKLSGILWHTSPLVSSFIRRRSLKKSISYMGDSYSRYRADTGCKTSPSQSIHHRVHNDQM